MSDFDKLLNSTLDNVKESGIATSDEMVLVCGHKVSSYLDSFIISAQMVGLNRSKSIQVCASCKSILLDKNHPNHLTVKRLVRSKARLL